MGGHSSRKEAEAQKNGGSALMRFASAKLQN